jgi:hypothetical protein
MEGDHRCGQMGKEKVGGLEVELTGDEALVNRDCVGETGKGSWRSVMGVLREWTGIMVRHS